MTNRNRRRRPYPPQVPPYAYPSQFPAPYAVPAPPFTAYTPGPDSNPPAASVTTLQDKNASVARVVLLKFTGPGEPAFRFEASGSAKREQGDVYDPRTGELLALARAYQRLSRQLAAEGNKRVREMTRQQAEAREEAERKAAEPPKEVRHRTLAEWQEIQRKRAFTQAQLEEDGANYRAAWQAQEQQMRGAQAGSFWSGPRNVEAGPARTGIPHDSVEAAFHRATTVSVDTARTEPEGVNSGNTRHESRRLELSGGRWIAVSEDMVLLFEANGMPSVVTRA